MITVSDSTPLIHFGTIKRLDLLRSMYVSDLKIASANVGAGLKHEWNE
jgi:hypothetical protein